jgi:hypothetical protein
LMGQCHFPEARAARCGTHQPTRYVGAQNGCTGAPQSAPLARARTDATYVHVYNNGQQDRRAEPPAHTRTHARTHARTHTRARIVARGSTHTSVQESHHKTRTRTRTHGTDTPHTHPPTHTRVRARAHTHTHTHTFTYLASCKVGRSKTLRPPSLGKHPGPSLKSDRMDQRGRTRAAAAPSPCTGWQIRHLRPQTRARSIASRRWPSHKELLPSPPHVTFETRVVRAIG